MRLPLHKTVSTQIIQLAIWNVNKLRVNSDIICYLNQK
jgi:hypothetical protein